MAYASGVTGDSHNPNPSSRDPNSTLAERTGEIGPSAGSAFPGFSSIAPEPAPDLASVVSLLGQRRRSLGMSQTSVAARMGTSQSAVARLEAGTDDVRLSTLERYAEAVDLKIGFTLGTEQ